MIVVKACFDVAGVGVQVASFHGVVDVDGGVAVAVWCCFVMLSQWSPR